MKITDDCISCGACADICPADAITFNRGNYGQAVIDKRKCKSCEICIDYCPADAIRR